MSRLSWSSQRVLGSVALACALAATGAVPAPAAVSLPSTASASASSAAAPAKAAALTAAAPAKAAARALKTAVPKITGTAKVGQKLTVNRGSWTSGTKLTQRWYRNGAAISGATGTSYTVKSGDAGASLTVRVTGAKAGYASATKTSAAVKVQKPATSNRSKPKGKNCPASHPIKGNASSRIYHKPGGQYYARTIPEECFKTETAAKAAGYRKSKR
jgi:hypothetical protein